MRRKGRSNAELAHALHQFESGEKVTEVRRRLGVSEQTFYRWKKQFSGLGIPELRELRSLRHETAKRKQVVADLTLDRHILQVRRPSMRSLEVIDAMDLNFGCVLGTISATGSSGRPERDRVRMIAAVVLVCYAGGSRFISASGSVRRQCTGS